LFNVGDQLLSEVVKSVLVEMVNSNEVTLALHTRCHFARTFLRLFTAETRRCCMIFCLLAVLSESALICCRLCHVPIILSLNEKQLANRCRA